jgi:hypothetical protein
MSESAVGTFLLMFLFGGGGIPLGVPPLPEDPVLAKIAPEECLVYFSSAGMAKPDVTSTNHTERLFAEPEIRHLVVGIERVIRAQIKEDKGLTDGDREKLADGLLLAKGLLTRPLALYTAQIKLVPGGAPDIRSGAVISLGEKPEDCTAAVNRLLGALPKTEVKEVTIKGTTFRQVSTGPKGPSITLGAQGKYLYLALGEGEMEALLKRAEEGTSPKWLTELKKKLPVPRVSTVGMVNAEKLVEVLGPLVGPELPRVLKATGLDGVERLEGVAGLDKEGYVSRSLLAVKGEPKGLLKLGQGLSAADLAVIPRDATFAAAGGLDPAKTYKAVMEIVEKIDPKSADEFRRHLGEVEEATGVALMKDVLEPLGHDFCVFDSPSGGGLFTGVTAVVSLKDAKAAAATEEKLIALAEKAWKKEGGGRAPKIEKVKIGKHTIHVLVPPQRDVLVAPSWCIAEKHLVFALYPEAVKAFLARGPGFQSLSTLPEIKKDLGEEGETIGLLYLNSQRLFDLTYPLAPVFYKAVADELGREGISVPPGLVPSAGSVRRHLRPSVTTKRRTSAGIEVVSRQTMPSSVSLSTAPLLAGLLVPAIQKVQEAARRTQSSNNLKQMALAVHGYHDAYNSFPPAYVPSKGGKPLLSWRVLILPYIEQNALYNEFKLDEPWDSEHNKKLIEKMPKVYRSPASKAAPGYTTYLTPRGANTVFPGSKGIRITDVTDGTSNTIMIVEASDKKAVPWTKPDDFEVTEKDPKAGLPGAWQGGFLVAFCDGSVRFIKDTVSPKTLLNLFGRNDGNVIGDDF